MSNYGQLVKALRCCAGFIENPSCAKCAYIDSTKCKLEMMTDAAAAIEALQAQLPKRGKWIWKHRHHGGFKTAKGKCECGRYVYAQIDERYETDDPYCPFCEVMNDSIHLNYCPNCGADMRAKMEVQE